MLVGTEVHMYVGTSSAYERTNAFEGLPADNHCILQWYSIEMYKCTIYIVHVHVCVKSYLTECMYVHVCVCVCMQVHTYVWKCVQIICTLVVCTLSTTIYSRLESCLYIHVCTYISAFGYKYVCAYTYVSTFVMYTCTILLRIHI